MGLTLPKETAAGFISDEVLFSGTSGDPDGPNGGTAPRMRFVASDRSGKHRLLPTTDMHGQRWVPLPEDGRKRAE